jgi:ABC-type uncharacterized transport system involved in gliding motility auxiliary subunit
MKMDWRDDEIERLEKDIKRLDLVFKIVRIAGWVILPLILIGGLIILYLWYGG